MSAISYLSDGWDFTYILTIISTLIPSLLCISLHELSHGWVAFMLGDDTAKRAGRLTLNPIKHLDPIGLLMMLVFRVGWARPVPVNMYRFNNPKRGMAVTAMAGPLSNLLIALVFMLMYGALFVPLRTVFAGGFILDMLQITVYLSLGLAVFNMLPFPPLDGSKVLFSIMSDRAYEKLMRYEKYGGLLLLLLMWTNVLGKPISYAIGFLYSSLIPIAQWACDTVILLFY